MNSAFALSTGTGLAQGSLWQDDGAAPEPALAPPAIAPSRDDDDPFFGRKISAR